MAEEDEEEHSFIPLELSHLPEEQQSLQVNPKIQQHSSRSKWTKNALLLLVAATLVLLTAVSASVLFLFRSSHRNGDTVAVSSIQNGSLAPGFHFQPSDPNLIWMTASNAPVFYANFYHSFYGFTVESSSGISSWGHVISKDLLHWIDLPTVLKPGELYDENGILGGSVTVLPDQGPIILYTGVSKDNVSTQNAAVPTDPHDPMLKNWKKFVHNPLVAMPPSGIERNALRDPSTVWKDGADWRVVLGSRKNRDGVGLVYSSSSQILEGDWKRLETPLLQMPGVGILESLDFFPVSGDKHILKASLRDSSGGLGSDYYTVGSYIPGNGSFVPDVARFGARYDHGDRFFASKTFEDKERNRRVLLALISGDINEQRTQALAPVQAIPRRIWLVGQDDEDAAAMLLQLPVDEVKSLRINPRIHRAGISLEPGAVIQVGDGPLGSQLDLEVVFELPDLSMQMSLENFAVEPSSTGNAVSHCREKGAGVNGILGPFGVLVLSTGDRAEQTAVFFQIGRSRKGPVAIVCADLTRSSLQNRSDPSTLHGAFVHLVDPSVYRKGAEEDVEVLEMRILVDNSVLEAFAQGGKVSITSRVYPTRGNGDAARVFLFNNGTTPVQLKRLDAWKMRNTVA